MEIHAPHHPALTLKEVLVHLCIVTAGIVIALSLEGALEWTHHRELVRETKRNLQNEIRNNQRDIQTVIKGLDAVKPRLVHAVAVVSDLSSADQRKEAASLFDGANPEGLLAGMSLAWLNTASYSTAQVTGAFGLMDYEEVRQYAEIYDPQALYSHAQDVAQMEAMAALALGQSILGNPTQANIEDVKRQLMLAEVRFISMGLFATVLNDRYAKLLKETP